MYNVLMLCQFFAFLLVLKPLYVWICFFGSVVVGMVKTYQPMFLQGIDAHLQSLMVVTGNHLMAMFFHCGIIHFLLLILDKMCPLSRNLKIYLLLYHWSYWVAYMFIHFVCEPCDMFWQSFWHAISCFL